MASIGLRASVARYAGAAASWASRVSGKGSGGMIGGRIAMKIDPQIAAKIAAPMQCAIVTGTNGKSTTTKMLNAALSTTAHTAWNNKGDNMTDGVTAALLADPDAPLASLEVDEMHVGAVSALVQPKVFVLLNLTRDQLDRVGEIAKVERHIRETLSTYPDAIVVANCDDPLVASAAWDCPHVVWVAAGSAWTADSTAFPRTGTRVMRDANGHWSVDDTYQRPCPEWWIEDNQLCHLLSSGVIEKCPLALQIPGAVNQGNAAQAVAAAVALGVKTEAAAHAVSTVRSVAGRYAHYDVNGKQVRLFLAKNPAGWQQALTMVDTSAPTVVFAINGQTADGKDLSWLWDVDFETGVRIPAETAVFACGERGADLGVRVLYAGIDATLVATPLDAVCAAQPGRVEVLANYTSFRDFKAALAKAGFSPLEEQE